MGLETGTYLDDLVATNPAANDKKSQGDDHLRLIKSLLKATFPNASKPFRFPEVETKAADYTVLSTDDNKVFIANASSADVGFTLPSLVAADEGWHITVQAADVTNDVTISPPSGTISGESSIALTKQYQCGTFIWDGTAFFYKEYDFVTADRLLGRVSTDGPTQEISLGAGLSFSGSTIVTDLVPPIPPQGILTLSTTSGEPAMAVDFSGVSTIYYDFDIGDLVPICDGTDFTTENLSARLSLTLNASGHLAGNIYDIFLFDDSGTLRLGTGPAWSTATAGSGARGTGAGTTELQRVHGVRVNKVSITLRNGATTYNKNAGTATWLGSFYATANGETSCHLAHGQSRVWGLVNGYNKRTRIMSVGDPTASWSYLSSTVRASNGDANNKATILQALQESQIRIEGFQNLTQNSTVGNSAIGVGVNDTTTISGYRMGGVAATRLSLAARHVQAPYIGINVFSFLESGTTNSTGWQGGEENAKMTFVFEA